MRGVSVRARGDVRLAPRRAARPIEGPTLVRDLPGDRVTDRATAKMQLETEQAALPAHPDGARAELVPHLVRDDRRVLELEGRGLVACFGEADDDFRDVRRVPGVHVDPRRHEAMRTLARDNRATRVAFELVVAAHSQVAADREEPASDPPGVGEGVPDVVDGRRVGAAQPNDAAGTGGDPAGAGLALDGLDLADDVDHLVDSFGLSVLEAGRRSRLPRASSVASESSRCS